MHSFPTSVGTVEIVVHEASRIVSISRLNAEGRPVASTMCDWDANDLATSIASVKVPLSEAREIADDVKSLHPDLVFAPPPPSQPLYAAPQPPRRLEAATISRRFAAVLLDSIIVFFPIGFLMGLMSGGGYAERGDGYANAGVTVGADVQLFFVFIGLCYYALAEGMFGQTLGKRIVGIRVVDEDGSHLGFGAAVVRNLLRLVDGLFFYLVGALFAFSSPRGQRLGDRAAHTVVVRRA
jgi:uncharacterized RDD family membrane protein YckC